MIQWLTLFIYWFRIKTRIQTEVETPKTTGTAVSTPSGISRSNAPNHITLKKGTGARKMLFRILKEQGIAGLYRGFGASMLNSFSMQLWVSSSNL